MKCHYEVLGVPRDATTDDLKKAYRKLALKWHPDKNLDNAVDAKEQFQIVQQAYEILSDPSEKKWYDEHREEILRSSSGESYVDDCLDVFLYFSPSCFKGYGDDDRGFYFVYREVFHKIAAEDAEYLSDSDFEYPSFGDSKSSYEEVVHPFYAFWQSYSTKRSYSWLSPFDIKQKCQKRAYRLIEKENKKVQEKARKSRNIEVRKLADFVRKRDKRVQTYADYLKSKSEANAKKAEENRIKQIKDRNKNLENYKETEWSKFSNVEHELKVIEANLASEFGELHSSDEGTETTDETMYLSLLCSVCNKSFRSEKTLYIHMSSKKHKEKVLLLTKDLDLNSDVSEEDISNGKNLHSDYENNAPVEDTKEYSTNSGMSTLNGMCVSSDNENIASEENAKIKLPDSVDPSSSDESLRLNTKKKRNKKLRKKTLASVNVIDAEYNSYDSDSVEVHQSNDNVSQTVENNMNILEDSDSELKCTSKKSVNRRRRNKQKTVFVTTDNTIEKCGNGNISLPSEKLNKKKMNVMQNVSNDDRNNCICLLCQKQFISKNKLFEHLKSAGHAAPAIPQKELKKKKKV